MNGGIIHMRKLLSMFCVVGLILCSISAVPANAEEPEKTCTEAIEERYSGLLDGYNLSVSNYSGSLCVVAETRASSVIQEIGIKNLTVQYSYDNSTWYDEWNAGKFCTYDSDEYTLSNYIMALDRHGCYYRVKGTHYAKASALNTQSQFNTSNSVWIS